MRILLSLLLLVAAPASGAPLDRNDRAQIINESAKLIEQRYVDPKIGKRIAASLRKSLPRWAGIDDPKQFATALSQWLQRESGDGHLGITYSERVIPDTMGDSVVSAAEMNRWYGPQLNHGVEKIERLEDNIMLIDLRVFPPTAMAGDVFSAAMSVAAQGDALIIDLRRNGGGAETAQLLMGYLLQGGSPLSGSYDRPTNSRRYASSPEWVPGRRFGPAKPLFVLTSKKTFSAAEAVAYDLQALKRAVIIGETTGGGAHPFEYRRIHPHFAVDLPEARSINPITGSNWQDIGVQPDVPIPADQALTKAVELARVAIKGRS